MDREGGWPTLAAWLSSVYPQLSGYIVRHQTALSSQGQLSRQLRLTHWLNGVQPQPSPARSRDICVLLIMLHAGVIWHSYILQSIQPHLHIRLYIDNHSTGLCVLSLTLPYTPQRFTEIDNILQSNLKISKQNFLNWKVTQYKWSLSFYHITLTLFT